MASNAAGFGWGLLAGAIAGVAIGMLYAPRPGREMRQLIMEKGQAVSEQAQEIAEDIKDRAQSMIGSVKYRASQMSHSMKEPLT